MLPIAADYPFMDVFWSMIVFFFWVIFVVILPWLGVLIYLIAQHDGMRERRVKEIQAQRQALDQYVRDASGGSAGEIAQAKQLLDSGTINQDEFEAIKAKALA